MAFAKFQEHRFRIDGEIAENHAILVYLTATRFKQVQNTIDHCLITSVSLLFHF